jgi:hypothetical protein
MIRLLRACCNGKKVWEKTPNIFILFDSNVNDNTVNSHLTVAFSGDIRKLLGSKEKNFFP